MSKTETIPWWSVMSEETEIANLITVINSGYYNEGEWNERFEQKLSKILEVKNIITTTSGTTALFCALKSIGIGSGSVVAVPNMTFIATANAVKLTGAEVELIDINPKNLLMDSDSLMKSINAKKIDAIIPVHVSGRSCFRESIIEIAQKYEIPIIEDAAEALFSKDPFSGKYLGTSSEIGIFSLSPNKIITTGQGGFIATNNDEIALSIRCLKDQGRETRGTGGDDLHPREGFNFKFTNLQAAIGLAQLDSINKRIKHLKDVYEFYLNNIVTCDHLKLLEFNTKAGELPLWPELISSNISNIIQNFIQNGIQFRKLWKPINSQESYLASGSFLNSKHISENGIWLPSSFKLSGESLTKIVECIQCEYCNE